MEHEGLRLGMFWAGVLTAAVPVLLALGVGVYVLRRYWGSRAPRSSGGSRE